MIDINCDVGEGLDNEHLLMPYISSCNIACGGHAGDERVMEKVATLAKNSGVNIGAHPSYPDKNNFGRISMHLSQDDLKNTLLEQIERLEKVAEKTRCSINHIKPHGALYNDLSKNRELSIDFLNAINWERQYKLFVPYGSIIADEAKKRDIPILFEAFADRNYNDDLSLVSRKESNALITEVDQVIAHVSQIENEHLVTTASGRQVAIKSNTYCVHSDTTNAVEIVQALHEKFN